MTTAPIESLAVFLSSRDHELFAPEAEHLGYTIARRGVRVIYGLGGAGLMGALARGARAAGGTVVGIAPHHLFVDERPTTPPGVEPLLTEGMHARKTLMYRGADAFLVGPGGLGTMDEFGEAAAWTQLGLHDHRPKKPTALLNWSGRTGRGYYEFMAAHLDHCVAEELLPAADRKLIYVAASSNDALDWLDTASQSPDVTLTAPHPAAAMSDP